MSSCSFTLASNCSLIGCSNVHFYLTICLKLLYGWQFKETYTEKQICTVSTRSRAHRNLRSSRQDTVGEVLSGMIGRPAPLTLRLTPRC